MRKTIMSFLGTLVAASTVVELLAAENKPPPDPGLAITREQARQLFGDRPAKLLLQKWPQKGSWMLDFSKEKLELKTACSCSNCGEMFFHPDGKRFVHVSDGPVVIAHMLSPSNEVVSTNTIGKGGKCRWWTHPKTADEYVIFPDSTSYNSEYPYGRTLIRKIKKGTIETDGPTMIMLDNLYMGDGRSADGKYVFGGLPATCIAEVEDPLAIENCKAKILWNAGDACNVSIYDRLPACFTYTDHKRIIFSKPVLDGAKHPEHIVLPNKSGWYQWLEWGTDMDYHTFSENPDGKRANGDFIGWILQASTTNYVKLVEHGGCTHLWVGAKPGAGKPVASARKST